MPKEAGTGTCNCSERHAVNGHRRDGRPVALWKCRLHGHVFEDRKSDVTLTAIQEMVLSVITKRGGAGSVTTDDVSRVTNLSMGNTQRAIDALAAAGYI